MTRTAITYRNGPIFDGFALHHGQAVRFEDGVLASFGAETDMPQDGDVVDLRSDILASGYVDLQVKGGGGVMFNDDPSRETLERITQAHRNLGVTAFLPTLITDTPEKTEAAIEAAIKAVASGMRGVAGLHLEGPHLSIARKGAHDASLVRRMTSHDLDILLAAAKALPVLKVTVAPENVGEDQVAALADAGVLVSLGHTDADYDTCRRYFASGARCVTHVFNAMSQLGSRKPGVVGAALAAGEVSSGMIADAVHVHPQTMRLAWVGKMGPGYIFLVSDAMAVAGTDLTSFELGGRLISRKNGILTLSDGTLAGADLDLTTAVRTLVEEVRVPLADALRAATTDPGRMIGRPTPALTPGGCGLPDFIRISHDLRSAKALS